MGIIEKWTEEIEKMKHQIYGWGMGVNSQEVGANFWQRNKTKCYTFLLFSGMGLFFYFLGWIGLARICLIVVVLQVISWGWGVLSGR